MNNSVYYKATDEDGNIILRHACNKKYQNGLKQNLEDGAARKKNDWKRELDFRAKINADKKKQNPQAREDHVRANRRKKVQKVVGEVKKLTKPGAPYKGPASASQAQQIKKDKELRNRKISKQNLESREKVANINRQQKAGKAYLDYLTK